MTSELWRYVEPLRSDQLAGLLERTSSAALESTGLTRDLGLVRTTLERLLVATPRRGERSAWDGELMEPLHQALRGLPRRIAVDMRFWHWLCVEEFPEFVWHRWYGKIPDSRAEALRDPRARELSGRFLGTATLNGVSRNALARLYWCAETLYSEQNGYRFAREVLRKQDLFQAIFEREFGLYPLAARACVRALVNESEEAFRAATKRLNHILTTLTLETLTEDDIVQLLRA